MFSTCQPARVCVRSGPAEAFSTSFASTSSCRIVIVTGVYVDTVQLMYSKMSASLAARWPVSMLLLLLVITVAAVSASPMKRAVRPLPDNNVDQFDALPDKVNNSERCLGITRAVLTNGHTGHVPRAPGFFLRGAQGPNAGKDGTGQH